MPVDHKVFISHTHAETDIVLCKKLERALAEWGVRYWVDTSFGEVGASLKDEILSQMRQCDVLIRLCTEAAQTRSKWVHREFGMFLVFQDQWAHEPNRSRGKVIDIFLDGYEPDWLEQTHYYIEARELPDAAWLCRLPPALDIPPPAFRFDNDDKGYVWWLHQYSDGFVINAYRRPTAVYSTTKNPQWQLHRATCGRALRTFGAGDENPLTGFPLTGFPLTGFKYVKVCSLDSSALEQYAEACKNPVAPFIASCQCLNGQ